MNTISDGGIIMSRDTAYVLWFDELHREDVDIVGGKSSSLGEMTYS